MPCKMPMMCRCGELFEASCAESSITGSLIVLSCILLLGAVAVYRAQSRLIAITMSHLECTREPTVKMCGAACVPNERALDP